MGDVTPAVQFLAVSVGHFALLDVDPRGLGMPCVCVFLRQTDVDRVNREVDLVVQERIRSPKRRLEWKNFCSPEG